MDAPDILVQICRKKVKEPIIVVGDYVVANDYGINSDNINNDCFENGHENLVRVFIPIIHRSKPQDDLKISIAGKSVLSISEDENSGKVKEDDFEIGVVELGYYNPKIPAMTKVQKEEEKSRFPEELLANLGFYIDNFSQPYYRAMLSELNNELFEELKKINAKNSDYENFMREGLEYAVDRFKGTYGSFVPIKHGSFPLYLGEEETMMYKYKKKDLLNVEEINATITKNFDYSKMKSYDQIGITNLALILKKPVLVNVLFQMKDQEGDSIKQQKKSSYLKMLEDVKSELAIPLLSYDDEVLGILLISADKINFFNKIHIRLYEKLAVELSRIFTNKKRLRLTQLISSPLDIFGQDSTTLFSPVLNVIAQHFDTKDISIWEGDGHLGNESDRNYALNILPSDFNKLLENEKITDLTINRNDFNKNKINIGSNEHIIGAFLIHHTNVKSISKMDTFCIANGYMGYLMLQVPVHQNKDYLITVFSKKPLNEGEIIGSSEEILLSIVDKMQSSFRLYSFTQILTHTEFEEERRIDSVIKILADTAFYALNATIVGVILCNPETNEILLEQSHIVYDSAHSFGDDRAILSEAIMKDTSGEDSWFFYTREHYMQFLKKKFKNENLELHDGSLLNTADIKSLAALKLTHENKVLGTLMVEYTIEGEVKNWEGEIKNFKRIAERLLKIDYDFKVKSSEMLELNSESELIKRQIHNLNVEKNSVEEKYVEAYEKMDELLPRAAGISYFFLVMAVKHDIRNFLGRLNSLLEESLEVFEASKSKRIIKDYNAVLDDCDLYVNKIADLIELFDFKNIENVPININSIIRDVVRLFKGLKDYNIKLELDKSVGTILGPKSRMSMILYNLMHNAIDAIEEKNEEMYNANFEGKILIKTWVEDNFFYVSIRDNGIGIPSDKMEWIFLPGKTTKTNKNLGIGIGLFFVKTALNDFFGGSEITPISKFGKYAKFILKIPKNANHGN